MPTAFHAGKPWPVLTRLCAEPGPRHAAVAFVGADAPRLMPLKRGDTLVVSAGKAALKSHATSPDVLQQYFDLGVRIYDDERLRAKVICAKHSAVVGSANASFNSTQLDEAAVITDAPAVVSAARTFVKQLTTLSRQMTLHMHHSSVSYRVGRITDQLGFDVRSTDGRYRARTAHLLWHLHDASRT